MKTSRWIVLLVGFFVAAGFGIWAYWTRDWREAASNLDRDYTEAKRLGLPLESKDLRPNPPVPDNQNAANLLAQAEDAFQYADSDHKKTSEIENLTAIRPLPVNKMELDLKPFDQALKLATEAGKLPRYDLRRDLDQGPMLLLPDLARCKSLVRVLTTRALLFAAKGNWPSCVADLKTARALAIDMGQEPSLISALVSVACHQLTTRSVESCMTLAEKDPAAIAALRDFETAEPPLPDFVAALRGEVFMGAVTIRNLDRLGGEKMFESPGSGYPSPQPDLRLFQKTGLPDSLKLRAYFARYLEFWNIIFATLAAGPMEPVALGQMLDDQAVRLNDSSLPSQRLNKILFPVFAGAGVAIVRADASLKTTGALCSVVAYRQKTGHWPATLPEAGVMTLDPFDKKPLRMRIIKGVVRIYSVGPDLRDSGGVNQSDGTSKGNEDDICAYFPSTARPVRTHTGASL
jgi:hypothetical protein